MRKLDIILGNNQYMNFLPFSLATFSPKGMSNHSLSLMWTGLSLPKVKKMFQFFNYMLQLEGFNHTLSTIWSQSIVGNPFFVFAENLSRLKNELIILNITHGNVSSFVISPYDKIHSIQ